jgi:hypothetical protein
MLCDLAPTQFARALPLFDSPHLALVARSVACGNAPGRFWADDAAVPRIALLWDQGRHLYLAGDDAAASSDALADLLRQTVLPGMLARGCSRYEAHASNEALTRMWTTILPDASARSRLFLTWKGARAPTPALSADPSLQLRPIDEALLRDDRLEYAKDVRCEVAGMWGSVEAFLRGGFGYCMANDREVVCWCTAEYVSPGWCGIGIETIEAYQRRGLATATATAFLVHCAAHGIQPHWDCWATNTPSVRVAEKVGLEPVDSYDVYCGTLLVPPIPSLCDKQAMQ